VPAQLLLEIRGTQGFKIEKGKKILRKSNSFEIYVYYNCGDEALAGNSDSGGYKFVFTMAHGMPTGQGTTQT
jgi:hypothetical protein